jgi:hypothetical protein
LKWLELAKTAFDDSTSYVDTNFRVQWNTNLAHFQNKHASDSKYNSDSYKHRSRLFRPKTRSVIRKNEAAAAAAFFSNPEVVSVEAVNKSDPASVAGAHLMKEVVNYRLETSIPWFTTLVGALQDAQTIGVVCSYQYWKKKEDKPCIELIPVENIRICPSANWADPINSSPYVIHMMPMYAIDAAEMWGFDVEELQVGVDGSEDVTRQARDDRENPNRDTKIREYSVVWVYRNFFQINGDWVVFHTLKTEKMLDEPQLMEQVYPFGHPLTMGCCVVETHKVFPAGVAELGEGLQKEANEIQNQRLDNVKLVLNKRWIAKRGAQVDVNSLLRNVPGGVTLATNPETDVKEINWPDVTQSAYMEQDRVNVDFDELIGNFSSGSVQTNRAMNETVGGMGMLNQGASQMTEFLLRVFTETWVKPVLKKLVRMEAAYETDLTVLAIAGQRAQLPKYGVNEVTDQMLNADLILQVNVGMGATNPLAKIQRFMGAIGAYSQIAMNPPPGLNLEEVRNEMFAYLGHGDGARFAAPMVDPRLAQAEQQIAELTQQLNDKSMEVQGKLAAEQIRSGAHVQIAEGKQQLEAAALIAKKDTEDKNSTIMAAKVIADARNKKEANGRNAGGSGSRKGR